MSKERYLRKIDQGEGVRASASVSLSGIATPIGAAITNADSVDGFHVSLTPTPGYLLPLDANGKFPSSAIPSVSDTLSTYDSTVATDTVIQSFLKVGGVRETNPRWLVKADGDLWWGAGGSATLDTWLERTGAAALATNAILTAAGVNVGTATGASSGQVKASGDINSTAGSIVASAGGVYSRGATATIWFADRADSLKSWAWYASNNVARIWRGTDQLTVSATGAVAAASFNGVTGLADAAPPALVFGDTSTLGVSPQAAREDHDHGLPAFAAPAIALGTAAAAGVATTPIRSDATIVAFDVTLPAALAMGQASATGAAAIAARRDHAHALPAFATPAIVLGTVAGAGVASTPLRSDATIVVFDGTLPATLTAGGAAAVGAAAVAARRDHAHAAVVGVAGTATVGAAAATGAAGTFADSAHAHAFPTGLPTGLNVGAAADAGISTSFPRLDHQHPINRGTPGNLAVGGAASGGATTNFAAGDHLHGIPTGTPNAASVGPAASTAGVSTSFPRLDHYHGIDLAAAYAWTGAHSFGSTVDVLGANPLRLGSDWQINRSAANTAVLGTGDALGSPNFVSGFEGAGWQIDGNGRAEFQSAYIRGTLYATTFTYKEVSALNGYFMVTNVAPLANAMSNDKWQNYIDLEMPVFRGNATEGYSVVRLQVLDQLPQSGGGPLVVAEEWLLIDTPSYVASTTNSAQSAGETQIDVASTAGFSAGQNVTIGGDLYTISSVDTTNVWLTVTPGLVRSVPHASPVNVVVVNTEGKPIYRYRLNMGYGNPMSTIVGAQTVGETWIEVASLSPFTVGGKVLIGSAVYDVTGINTASSYLVISPALTVAAADGQGISVYQRSKNGSSPYAWKKKTAAHEWGRINGSSANKGGWVTMVGGSTDVEGPYTRVSQRFGNYFNDYKVRVHLGQMYGILGETLKDRFGFAAGDSLAAGAPGSTSRFLAFDEANGLRLQNVDLSLYNGANRTVSIQPDGDLFMGSDVAAAATTSLAHFATAQTYNGESLVGGSVLLGVNTTGYSNLLWHPNDKVLRFRDGIITKVAIGNLLSDYGVNYNGVGIGQKASNKTWITVDNTRGLVITRQDAGTGTQTIAQWDILGDVTLGNRLSNHIVIDNTSISMRNAATETAYIGSAYALNGLHLFTTNNLGKSRSAYFAGGTYAYNEVTTSVDHTILASFGMSSTEVIEPGARFSIKMPGLLQWGPGIGTGAADTDLFRNGINELKTNSKFVAGGDLTGGGNLILTGYADLGPKARVGTWVGDGQVAAFAHQLMWSTVGSYALIQSPIGQTALNSAAAQSLFFRIGDSTKLEMTSNGALLATNDLYLTAATGTGGIEFRAQGEASPGAWRFIFASNTNTESFGIGANNFGIYNDTAGVYLLSMNTSGEIGFGGPVSINQNFRLSVGNTYLSSGTANYLRLSNNSWFNGTAWLTTGVDGVLYQQAPTAHEWWTSPASGTNHVKLMTVATSGTSILTPLTVGGFAGGVVSVTAAYTVVASDFHIFGSAAAAAFTVTLPPVASSTGRRLTFTKTDSSANIMYIDANGTEFINGSSIIGLNTQYQTITIGCNGTQWYIISFYP